MTDVHAIEISREKNITLAGDNIPVSSARWTFGNDVAEHFDDHVAKSVPLYCIGHDLIVSLSDYFIKCDSVCYEIGCSTGTLISQLASRHSDYKNARFVGLDVESEMIAKAQQTHSALSGVTFQNADAVNFEFASADMIVSYYVVQFVSPKLRQQLFDKIYASLNWGGAFVMYEKTRASDARFQDIFTSLYNEYKLSKGYTPDEVLSKTMSLKGVLEPYSTQANVDYLKRAGFNDVITIQKYLGFEGFLAIK